ncbi:MAG: hypothetical protein WC250_00145 [Candidatus Paceibacterota bacterium]|jgi:hypothetical protein
MRATIKLILEEVTAELCEQQDFEAAATVRNLKRLVDPEGIWRLSRLEEEAARKFLKVLIGARVTTVKNSAFRSERHKKLAALSATKPKSRHQNKRR